MQSESLHQASVDFFFTIGIKVADEICDNGIDDNGDGLIDCQDPQCQPTLHVIDTHNDSDITNPGNAIGSPDGLFANIGFTESIDLELENAIDTGTVYTVHVGSINGSLRFEESIDGINYFLNSTSPVSIVNPTGTTSIDVVASHRARFIRVTFFQVFVGFSMQFDGIEYQDCICQPTTLIGEYQINTNTEVVGTCLLYTSPSPRDKRQARMPSSA